MADKREFTVAALDANTGKELARIAVFSDLSEPANDPGDTLGIAATAKMAFDKADWQVVGYETFTATEVEEFWA